MSGLVLNKSIEGLRVWELLQTDRPRPPRPQCQAKVRNGIRFRICFDLLLNKLLSLPTS